MDDPYLKEEIWEKRREACGWAFQLLKISEWDLFPIREVQFCQEKEGTVFFFYEAEFHSNSLSLLL